MKFELEAWRDGQRADRIDCVVRAPGGNDRRLVIDKEGSKHEAALYRFLDEEMGE
jgi:hypothetical protein